jgi:hypothetical protein
LQGFLFTGCAHRESPGEIEWKVQSKKFKVKGSSCFSFHLSLVTFDCS